MKHLAAVAAVVLLMLAFFLGGGSLPFGFGKGKGKDTLPPDNTSEIQRIYKKRCQDGWAALTGAEKKTLRQAYQDETESMLEASSYAARVYQIRRQYKLAEEMTSHTRKLKETLRKLQAGDDSFDAATCQRLLDEIRSTLE
jgi:hypothetical protein